MAALLGREVLTKDYETVRIRIAFHPIEEKFEVANPAIRKDVAWIEDVAAVFAPDARSAGHDGAYSKANPGADQEAVGTTLEKLRKIINNHVGIIELAEDLDIETVTEIFIRVNSAGAELDPGRLRHVEDRRQRDLRRQHAAQGDRLLLPLCGRARLPRAHRKGRQELSPPRSSSRR